MLAGSQVIGLKQLGGPNSIFVAAGKKLLTHHPKKDQPTKIIEDPVNMTSGLGNGTEL